MYKTKLQQLFQQNQWPEPEYSVSKEGPAHNLRFTATVTAKGECFQSSNPCRTSRTAQNNAAEIALGHFFGPGYGSKPQQILQNENAPAPNPLPHVLPISHNDGSEVKLTVQSHATNKLQLPLTHLEVNDYKNSLDGGHWYKNRLQNYLQKRNLTFPEYAFERQGPSHASYFRCKVTVCGQTYESRQFFLTMREAENAAAKIAFEQVSANEVQEVDFGLHKNALQELAHKRGFLSPSYKTESCGPGHSLTFLSTVIVDDKIYQGLPAKSKKQAEVNAAKLAYDSLQDFMNLGTHLQDPCVSTASKEVVMFEPAAAIQNAGNDSSPASHMLEQEDIRYCKKPRSYMSC